MVQRFAFDISGLVRSSFRDGLSDNSNDRWSRAGDSRTNGKIPRLATRTAAWLGVCTRLLLFNRSGTGHGISALRFDRAGNRLARLQL